jgi:hypothetical protein
MYIRKLSEETDQTDQRIPGEEQQNLPGGDQQNLSGGNRQDLPGEVQKNLPGNDRPEQADENSIAGLPTPEQIRELVRKSHETL